MSQSFLRILSSKGIYSVDIVSKLADFRRLNNNSRANVVCISDSIVWETYSLGEYFHSSHLMLCDVSSNTKQLSSVVDLLEEWCSLGLKKNDQVIVIGGATLQDLCGTAAGLFHRGIDWSYIPTTLLSQGDSCIGSKTSIDSKYHKNQFGLFNPPRNIYICPEFLSSLPIIELVSGYGDILHYTLPYQEGVEDLSLCIEALKSGSTIDIESTSRLTSLALSIKSELIETDEFDKGPRAIFNYGHTFAHVLEKSTRDYLPHGVAVLLGILCAERACAGKFLKQLKINYIRNLIDVYSYNVPCLPSFDADNFIHGFKKDKKNNTEGKVRLIIPCSLENTLWKSSKYQSEYGLCTRNIPYEDAAIIVYDTLKELNLIG